MELAAARAMAQRIIAKFDGKPGLVTKTSTALNDSQPVQTARVSVRIINREASTTDETINAVMTSTPFPVEGCALTVGGKTYDIIKVLSSGLDDYIVTQRVVLHGR